MHKFQNIVKGLLFVSCLLSLEFGRGHSNLALAQVDPPDRKNLFEEDTRKNKTALADRNKQIIKSDASEGGDVDFKAPQVEFSKENDQVIGSGGVLISGQGIQVQSEQAKMNTETKDASLSEKVLFTVPGVSIASDSASVNIDTETGEFDRGRFDIDDGGYQVRGDTVKKLSDTEYEVINSRMSTCHCSDDDLPWELKSDRSHITQEGYAHTYGTTMSMFGVPFFYTPYLAFPVKSERSSGLLAPEFGYSSRDGLRLKLPFYLVLDDSTDMIIAPFTETKTRTGASVDFRKKFSRYNDIDSRFIFSDESARDGSLRGTTTEGIFDPDPTSTDASRFYDEQRIGGFYTQKWRSSPDSDQSWNFISDLHYVSDDLFLRELPDEDIAERTARYTTSNMVLRTGLGEYGSAEVSGEFNQSLTEVDDDLVFQRLPEARIQTSESFRPFANPFGLKLVTRLAGTSTDFVRKEGFDGWRSNVNPNLTVPFHVKNYVAGSFDAGFNQTWYNLDQTNLPGTPDSLEQNQDRQLFNASYTMATVLERVYEVEKDSWITDLTGLGAKNQVNELVRLKHTIEPTLKYTYVPDTSQDDLPLFDSFDRVREKSLFTAGIKSSIYGRFLPRGGIQEAIPELMPRPQDLPGASGLTALPDFGSVEDDAGQGSNIRKGEIRELASFNIRRSFDYYEAIDNNDPARNSWSDVGSGVTLYPTPSFALLFNNNYKTGDRNFSSWDVGTSLRDDRGDVIKARYAYVNGSLSQLQANLEIKLTDRFKVGYFTIYDDLEHEFIENAVALRLYSAYDCWHLDLGFSDRINPDKQLVELRFTFAGLGDISQDVLYPGSDKRGGQL